MKIYANKIIGKIKPMHAVNNGPVVAGKSQHRSNIADFTAAGIPFVRTHDSSYAQEYGSEHTVDIHAVFPDFDADPYCEESYDFPITDKYMKDIISSGAEVFYRLGARIEHDVKKYLTLPPRDNQKWAVICEHIIRHYNEGWNNGFHYNIRYWEIWNEPDLDRDDSNDKRTWGGTFDEFLLFYKVAAKHLKACFPELKIGGPAFAGVKNIDEGSKPDRFLSYMRENNVPMDFFSWHIYTTKVSEVKSCADNVRCIMHKYNYDSAESILNEWNYIENWSSLFVHSLEMMTCIKGAAFNGAVMTACQNTNVDMLMYYDARPCVFNGLFDIYTLKPHKGYYPYLIFGDLYKKGSQLAVDLDDAEDCIDIVAAQGEQGDISAMLTYYSDDGNGTDKTFSVVFDRFCGKISAFLLDETHSLEKIKESEGSEIVLTMKQNTVIKLCAEKVSQ